MALGTLGDSEFIGNRHGTKALDVIALHGWGRSGTDFSTVLKDTPGFSGSPSRVWFRPGPTRSLDHRGLR